MKITPRQVEARASELERLAAERKVDWRSRLKELPPDDAGARAALIATMLGIDVVSALNVTAPLPQPEPPQSEPR